MAVFKGASELCDVISQSVYCPEDSSYMLILESTTNEFWVPSTKVSQESSWQAELSKDCVDVAPYGGGCWFTPVLISDFRIGVDTQQSCSIAQSMASTEDLQLYLSLCLRD